MARITVDDCLKKISNRFQLTLAATYRAHRRRFAAARAEQGQADRDRAARDRRRQGRHRGAQTQSHPPDAGHSLIG